jgi:hypothetical protein
VANIRWFWVGSLTGSLVCLRTMVSRSTWFFDFWESLIRVPYTQFLPSHSFHQLIYMDMKRKISICFFIIFIMHHLCIMVLLNWIRIQLNVYEFNEYSIQFKNLNQFNSSCMQSHLIFSFKWNLFFTKSTHFFHHFIFTSNGQQHETQVWKK